MTTWCRWYWASTETTPKWDSSASTCASAAGRVGQSVSSGQRRNGIRCRPSVARRSTPWPTTTATAAFPSSAIPVPTWRNCAALARPGRTRLRGSAPKLFRSPAHPTARRSSAIWPPPSWPDCEIYRTWSWASGAPDIEARGPRRQALQAQRLSGQGGGPRLLGELVRPLPGHVPARAVAREAARRQALCPASASTATATGKSSRRSWRRKTSPGDPSGTAAAPAGRSPPPGTSAAGRRSTFSTPRGSSAPPMYKVRNWMKPWTNCSKRCGVTRRAIRAVRPGVAHGPDESLAIFQGLLLLLCARRLRTALGGGCSG